MFSKIREISEYPQGLKKGDKYHCEICGETEMYLDDDLIQCPECGRWVCSDCFELGSCQLCRKKSPPTSEIEEIKHHIGEFESEIKVIKDIVTNLRKKVDKFRICPSCGAPVVAEAEYCGICGKKL